jgi:hypothetical protein
MKLTSIYFLHTIWCTFLRAHLSMCVCVCVCVLSQCCEHAFVLHVYLISRTSFCIWFVVHNSQWQYRHVWCSELPRMLNLSTGLSLYSLTLLCCSCQYGTSLIFTIFPFYLVSCISRIDRCLTLCIDQFLCPTPMGVRLVAT